MNPKIVKKELCFLFFLVFITLPNLGMAQNNALRQPSVFEAATPIPRTYVAHQTLSTITIDGIANEKDWKAAPWSGSFIDIEGKKIPKYKTQMKILWNTSHIYFYAQMEEPHVWGTLKERDTVIFYNNDFEIFIDPDGDTHHYVELEVNALNTVWDLFLTAPYRNNPKVLNQWDMKGLQSAVAVQGTLNNPLDTDQGWSVEVAIPWAVFREITGSGRPAAQQVWRMGFSRVNWQHDINQNTYTRKKDAKGAYLPEYNWVWSPQMVVNMHEPEKWGYVYFSNNPPETLETFTIQDQEYLKWFMYQEYRKLLSAYTKGKPLSSAIIQNKITLKGAAVVLEVVTHLAGFSLVCKSPFNNQTLEINTQGKFKTYENNAL